MNTLCPAEFLYGKGVVAWMRGYEAGKRGENVCTRFGINGMKAMSRGISGGKQEIKFAKARNRGRLCLFSQNETTI